MALRLLSFLFLFLYSILTCIPANAQEQKSKTDGKSVSLPVKDVIPITVGNLRGHKMLYNEGWHVVTSSSRAMAYAKERSITSSRQALKKAAEMAVTHSAEYTGNIKGDVKDSVATGKAVATKGTEMSSSLLETTHDIAKKELAYSKETFGKAMGSFIQGNISLRKRTEKDRGELAELPGNYFKSLKNDFSNIYDLAEATRKKFSGRIDPQWETAFGRAATEFKAEYEESGKKQNTLLALGPILAGYLKSFYYGLAAPTSKQIVKTTVAGTTYAVFLPVSATAVVAGRTVQSVGLTVYYVGKTGVEIVSPTLEGGLLTGLSLLSLGSVPVTYIGGGTLGAVNQVAFTTAAPVAGAAEAAVKTTSHTAAYVCFLAYDAVTGTTKVVINQALSGVVLGYNALTAIPTHALIGVADTAIFLAWDGPRLVIASAQGRVKYGADKSEQESVSLGDLPIGTVVNLGKLEHQDGVKVDILSTDPEVINNVLDRIPDDARETDESK